MPFWALALVWTLLIGVTALWNVRRIHDSIHELARVSARSVFEKDVVLRKWAAMHGGVYVPVTERTPPNPYLTNVLERDITTPSGRSLTLMNPAYITRQVHELGKDEFRHQGHITSLKPIRPQNGPDAWERQALESFDRGEAEFSSVELVDGEPHLRLMRPLRTARDCLKCHATQGYKEGDIRGGISVAVPLKTYHAGIEPQARSAWLAHGGIWLVGLCGFGFLARHAHRRHSEREAVWRSLEASELRFSRMFQASPVGAHLFRLSDGQVVDVNDACLELLGYARDEVVGHTVAELNLIPDAAAREAALRDLMEHGRVQGREFQVRQKTGRTREVLLAMEKVEVNGVEMALCVASDITERKANERLLRESEAHYRALFQAIGEGLAVHGFKPDGSPGRFIEANQFLCDRLGYTREELLSRTPRELAVPDAGMDDVSYAARLRAGEMVVLRQDHLSKDGRHIPVEIHARRFNMAGQDAVLFLAQDLTLRSRAERALQRTQHSVDSIADSIFWIDQDARFVFVNRAACRNLGYTQEELLKLTVFDIDPAFPRAHWPEHWSEIEARRSFGFETTHCAKGGRKFPVEVTVNLIVFEGQVYNCAIARDISERKRAQEAVIHSRDLMRYVIEHTRSAVAVHDRDMRYIYVSKRYLDEYGVQDPNVIGKHHYEVFPDLPEKWRVVHRKALAGVVSSAERDDYQRADGTVEWTRWECRPWFESNGRIGGIIVYTEVITDRVRAEEALRASEEQFRGLFSAMQEGFALHEVICDDQGHPRDYRYLEVNAAFERATGISRDRWIGHTVREVLPQVEEHWIQAFGEVALTGTPKKFTNYVRELDQHYEVVAYSPRRGQFAVMALDVTERKRVELALEAESTRRRVLFEQSPDGILIIDPQTAGFLEFNTAAHRQLGYSREEFARLTIFDIEAQETPDQTKATIEGVISDGACDFETRQRTRQGEIRDVHVTAQVVMIQGQAIYQCTWRDITERKRAEEALRLSEKKFASVFQNAPVWIAISDLASGRYVDVNEQALRDSGFSREEVIGKRSVDIGWISAEDRERVLRSVESHGRVLDTEMEFRTKHGRTVVGLVNAERIAIGEQQFLLSVTADITERKLAEEKLRRSEADLLEAQRLARVGNWRLDYATRKIQWSRELHEIFELAEAEFDGSYDSFLAHVHPEDAPRVLAAVEQARASGVSWEIEYRFQAARGRIKFVREIGNATRSDGGLVTSLYGTTQDITSTRQLEEQLRQSQKMEAVGRLAGGVAHDFNNLLTAMLMNVELLQENPAFDAAARETLGEIGKGAERAADLTRQLLLFGRRSTMQAAPINVGEVVTGLQKMLDRLLGEKVVFEASVQGDFPLIHADRGMIEQMVVNLCVNARDAMPEGGRLGLRLDLTDWDAAAAKARVGAREGRFLCVTISDTGCGMDQATLDRIYEPFFTTKPAGQGTGLGLSTVHGIVRQHRGWIEVESALGRGTTFRIYLPVPTEPLAIVPEAGTAQNPPAGGNEVILLVEDERLLRVSVAHYLRKCGYQVLEAANAEAALEIWRERSGQVDLLFTDMVMPGKLNGLQLAERFRAEKPGLRILLASGYSTELTRKGAGALPGARFLAKPCPPAKLARAVRECLDQPCAQT